MPNHGIPLYVLDVMIEGILKFYEQDAEVKKEYYSRGHMKKAICRSNVNVYGSYSANWRNTGHFYDVLVDNCINQCDTHSMNQIQREK